MTLPTIFPIQFAGTSKDFLKAKFQADGTSFMIQDTVSVLTGTVVTTIVGLIPFQANCRIQVPGLTINSAALGTSVTASVGVIYDDNTNNTNNATLYASALTTVAAGGNLTLTPSATNLAYVTTANGWLAVTLGGATTGSTGSFTFQALFDYSA